MKDVFDWDVVRPALITKPKTREAAIQSAFWQYADGNDLGETLGSGELNHMYDAFRAAWIIHEETFK